MFASCLHHVCIMCATVHHVCIMFASCLQHSRIRFDLKNSWLLAGYQILVLFLLYHQSVMFASCLHHVCIVFASCLHTWCTLRGKHDANKMESCLHHVSLSVCIMFASCLQHPSLSYSFGRRSAFQNVHPRVDHAIHNTVARVNGTWYACDMWQLHVQWHGTSSMFLYLLAFWTPLDILQTYTRINITPLTYLEDTQLGEEACTLPPDSQGVGPDPRQRTVGCHVLWSPKELCRRTTG